METLGTSRESKLGQRKEDDTTGNMYDYDLKIPLIFSLNQNRSGLSSSRPLAKANLPTLGTVQNYVDFESSSSSLGYKQSQRDHILLLKHSQGGKLIVLLVYVADIIVTTYDLVERQLLKEKLFAV
ncbi:hypothetical protein CR513_58588, partial [Mucuna pruriens]